MVEWWTALNFIGAVPGLNPQNVHSSIRTKIVSFTANAILCLNVQKLHFTGEGYSVPLGKAELILLLWRYQARTGMAGNVQVNPENNFV